MQRLYPVLLSISIALAVAIFLRPRLAEDLRSLAISSWNSLGSAAQAAAGSGDSRSSDASSPANSYYPGPSISNVPNSTWPTSPSSSPTGAAPAASPIPGPAGQTVIFDVPEYPSTGSPAPPMPPSAPAWQPPQQQNAMPAWQQNALPAGQQTSMPAGRQGPATANWSVPPSDAPMRVSPNGAPPYSAPGESPGANLPTANLSAANSPGGEVAPAAPVWKIPEMRPHPMRPQMESAPSQAPAFVAPRPQQEALVAGSLPPAGWSRPAEVSPSAADPRPGQVFDAPLAVAASAAPQSPVAGQIPPEAELFERGQIVGRVGTEVILYGEIALGIPELRAQYQDRMSPEQLEKQIEMLLKSRLKPHLETKLVYLDAKRTIPPDSLKAFEKKVAEEFERSQVDQIMKSMKVNSRHELEEKLRSWNSSIEQQKRVFVQQMIAHEWTKQQVKVDEEVTYEQMLAYYRDHVSDYEQQARARWQQLQVRFSRVPDKAQAYRIIAEMGNEVLGGRDFAEVAKAGSDGPTARTGGQRDWTTAGSLVSEALDKALFTLPVGQLSPILEDEQGFHIVCVLERKAASRTPFDEVQPEIRKKVREQRKKGQEEIYLAKLWEKTPIWTAFDGAANEMRAAVRVQAAGVSQASRANPPR